MSEWENKNKVQKLLAILQMSIYVIILSAGLSAFLSYKTLVENYGYIATSFCLIIVGAGSSGILILLISFIIFLFKRK
jgi:chromate transport protein ChrA